MADDTCCHQVYISSLVHHTQRTRGFCKSLLEENPPCRLCVGINPPLYPSATLPHPSWNIVWWQLFLFFPFLLLSSDMAGYHLLLTVFLPVRTPFLSRTISRLLFLSSRPFVMTSQVVDASIAGAQRTVYFFFLNLVASMTSPICLSRCWCRSYVAFLGSQLVLWCRCGGDAGVEDRWGPRWCGRQCQRRLDCWTIIAWDVTPRHQDCAVWCDIQVPSIQNLARFQLYVDEIFVHVKKYYCFVHVFELYYCTLTTS